MANGAGRNLPLTGGHQGLALLEAARRHVGDEAGARVTQKVSVIGVDRSFDDTIADRLSAGIGAGEREEQPPLRSDLRQGRKPNGALNLGNRSRRRRSGKIYILAA